MQVPSMHCPASWHSSISEKENLLITEGKYVYKTFQNNSYILQRKYELQVKNSYHNNFRYSNGEDSATKCLVYEPKVFPCVKQSNSSFRKKLKTIVTRYTPFFLNIQNACQMLAHTISTANNCAPSLIATKKPQICIFNSQKKQWFCTLCTLFAPSTCIFHFRTFLCRSLLNTNVEW